MRSSLDLIETRLRRIFEGSSLWLAGGDATLLLSQRLVEAMQSDWLENDRSQSVPGMYVIYLHPSVVDQWQQHERLLQGIGSAILEAAAEAGIPLSTAPGIRLAADPRLTPSDLRILPGRGEDSSGNTDMIAIMEEEAPPLHTDARPANAFLILDGNRIHPLRQVVINIGRRQDNHIVLNDPRISRNHAQLRAVRGHYVIIDLNSTGGTYVNSMRISQQQLRPGDVISLAGYAIIYGEDNNQATGDNTAVLPVDPRTE